MVVNSKVDISIIIVNFKTPEVTAECISSLYQHLKCSFEIIVVDNNSEDNSREIVTKNNNEIYWVQLDKNMGYGYAMNRGFEKSHGDYILILNSDIMILSDFFNSLKELYIKHTAGVLGIKLILPNDKIQQTASSFPRPMTLFANEMKVLQSIKKYKRYTMNFNFDKDIHEVDWVTGAFMFISKGNYSKVLGFNESYFMYYEDVALCRRIAERGFSNFYITSSQAMHKHSYSVDKQKNEKFNAYKVKERESAITYIKEFFSTESFHRFILIYRLIFIYKLSKDLFLFLLLFFIKRKRKKNVYSIRTNMNVLKKINSINHLEEHS